MHTSKTGKKAIKSSETSSNPEQKTILPNARNENRGRTDMAVSAYGSDCHAAVTFTRFFFCFATRATADSELLLVSDDSPHK